MAAVKICQYFILSCIVLLSTTPQKGYAYLSGAPYQTCLTMYPHHGVNHQETATPFKIIINKNTYSPSEELTAVIKTDDNTEFKGIEMRVHRLTGNTQEILGEFTEIPTEKIKTVNCYFGQKNLITHKNNETVTSLTVKWRAPAQNVGDIQFTATVVKNLTVFWYEVKATVQAETQNNIVPASFQLPNVSSDVSAINWADCGVSRGCFYHPPTCTGADCNFAVTYTANEDETYSFEMVGRASNGAGWIAVAMSEDKLMGEDQDFFCTVNAGVVEVGYGYNPAKFMVQELSKGFSDVATKLMDGKIYCSFTRVKLSSFDHNGEQNFDLSKPGYMFFAWGETYLEIGELKKHTENPAVSYSVVSLNDNTIHTANKPTSAAVQTTFYIYLIASLCFMAIYL